MVKTKITKKKHKLYSVPKTNICKKKKKKNPPPQGVTVRVRPWAPDSKKLLLLSNSSFLYIDIMM